MRAAFYVLPGLLFVGCNGDDEDEPFTSCPDAIYLDADGDTYGDVEVDNDCALGPNEVIRGGDCDDTDPAINPDALEDCTLVDNNCDGDPLLDAGPVLWYLDEDGDGFGDDAFTIESCEQPPYHRRQGGDCAPLDPEIYPRRWYADLDGDGYGDDENSNTTLICEPPPLSSTRAGDCDDADATTHEGANELCDGGVDNDCDPSTDENDTAEWYPDVDEDGFGDDTSLDVYRGCAPPPGLIQTGGDCDDRDAALNPVLTPGCVQIHDGAVLDDEIWRNTVEHRVVGNLRVEGPLNPTLRIESGAIIRIDPGSELRIGDADPGRIVVEGTETEPVTFTTSAPVVLDADDFWHGLRIGNEDSGSSLSWLLVDYAGLDRNGAVEFGKADLAEIIEVTGLTVRNSLSSGLYVSAGEPSVTRSTFVDNAVHGVEITEGSGVRSFTNNILGANDDFVLVIPGSHAFRVDPSNDFSRIGNPEPQRIEIVEGTMRLTGTWYDHGLTYVVRQNATVDVEDGPQADLTIEDGVTVEFGRRAGLRIGRNAEGQLTLEEGPAGILFTLAADAMQGDNWDGVEFGPGDGGSLIQNLTIEYGGFNGRGNLYVNDSAPTITGVTSRFSDSSGLYVAGDHAEPQIDRSFFTDNDEDGVYVASGSGIARAVGQPTFQQNTISGNGGSPVVMPPNYIGELDPTTVFSGNAHRITIHGGSVLEDATWQKLDEDYQVLGDINIGGPQDPVVAIESANTFYFERDTGLRAGINDDGSLIIAAGSEPTNWVRMTSADAAPGPGDWEGLRIGGNGLVAPPSSIEGLVIEYAGGTGSGAGGAIELRGPSCTQPPQTPVQLHYVTITDSSRSALYLDDHASLLGANLEMSGALEGCLATSGTCAVVGDYRDSHCVDGPRFGLWPLDEASHLADNNTLSGPVTLVSPATLTETTTVPNVGQVYVLPNRVAINAPTGPSVTLQDGVIMEFDSGAGFDVAASQNGSLIIGSGVVLRPTATAPSWWGIRLGPQCATVAIDGATVQSAGGNGEAAIWIDDCAAGVLANTTIENAIADCGVTLSGAATEGFVPLNMTYVGPGLCLDP